MGSHKQLTFRPVEKGRGFSQLFAAFVQELSTGIVTSYSNDSALPYYHLHNIFYHQKLFSITVSESSSSGPNYYARESNQKSLVHEYQYYAALQQCFTRENVSAYRANTVTILPQCPLGNFPQKFDDHDDDGYLSSLEVFPMYCARVSENQLGLIVDI